MIRLLLYSSILETHVWDSCVYINKGIPSDLQDGYHHKRVLNEMITGELFVSWCTIRHDENEAKRFYWYRVHSWRYTEKIDPQYC